MEIIAKLDFEENVFLSFENTLNIEKYKNFCTCEICKKDIPNRKTSFLIRNEKNEILQVGKTCLKNFLNEATEKEKALLICENMEGLQNLKLQYYNTLQVIAISKYMLNNSNIKIASIFDFVKNKDILTDEKESTEVIKFFENLETNNNFILSIKDLLKNEYINILKYGNIAKYIFKVYQEEKAKQENLEALENQEIFKNDTFILKDFILTGTKNFKYSYNNYTTSNIYLLFTNDNFILQYETQKTLTKEDLNKKFTCKIKNTFNSLKYNKKITKVTYLKKI